MTPRHSFYRRFVRDSLYRNSLFLLLGTYTQAVLGFLFWLLASRFYSSTNIGLATALVSSVAFLTTLSIIGMDNSFIRFLSDESNIDDLLNTGFTLIILMSSLVGTVYVLLITVLSPKLSFIQANVFRDVVSITMIIGASLCVVTDYVFMALRRTEYVFGKSLLLGLVKLVLLFTLLSLGAYGLFLASSLAMIVSFTAGIIVLMFKYSYTPKLGIDYGVARHIAGFASANYFANIFEALPMAVLPIMVVNRYSGSQAAYFYIALMIAVMLYSIPVAFTQSLFAESAADSASMKRRVSQAVKSLAVVVLLLVLIFVVMGRYILLAFGHSYAVGGSGVLVYFVVAAIPISVGYVCETVLRIQHRNKQLVASTFIRAVGIIVLCYVLTGYSFVGVGVGWLLGQTTAAIVLMIFVSKRPRSAAAC
jgi:O-antigen/teichoic acid export membrane protein